MSSKTGHLFIYIAIKQASLGAQTEKNLPSMQADAGLSPGSGRSPGEGIATHSSILDWRIPWTEEPGRPQSMRLQRVRHDWATNTFNSLSWFPTVGAIALKLRSAAFTYRWCSWKDVQESTLARLLLDPVPPRCRDHIQSPQRAV